VSVDSIDISEDELRTALLNAKSAGVDRLINFHIGDANELPFEDEHFRLVTMVNLIHHVESYGGILGEVSRVLGPGGKFLVSDFTGEGFDILDRIHESEGRVHPRPGRNGIDDVAGSLSDFGLQCLGRDIRFQEYVMLAEKL
ncbi:MAG: methyltransferase domain-containing protein, partial [Candidatus Krumholzibacteria bacterium]|nr:methyltransferase domain-containing protein [Candidatus Krumholzibacteria bacterium]